MRLYVGKFAGKRGGIVPFLLALLLAVRVVASPAIHCQHELATQSTLAALAATGIPIEAGELCGLPLDGSSGNTEDIVNALCPFFMAPGILPECGAEAAVSDQHYSQNWFVPAALHLNDTDGVAGYQSRAPPHQS